MKLFDQLRQPLQMLGPLIFFAIFLPFLKDPGLSDQYLVNRQLFLAIGLIISFAYWIRRSELSLGLGDGLILCFGFIHSLSAVWAINPEQALLTSAQCWLGIMVYFYWRQIPQKDRALPLFITIVHWVALIYVIVVWAAIIHYGLEYGWTNKDLYRLQYPGGHKSLIAEFLVLLLPFVMEDRRISKWKWLTITLIVGAILILQSRAAILALVLVLSLFAFLQFMEKPGLRKYILLIFGGFLIGVAGLQRSDQIPDRMQIDQMLQSQTGQERLLLWEKTLHIIAQHPILGVGAGNWKIHLPSQQLEDSWTLESRDVIFTRAHNDVLEITAEVGLIGGLLWLGLMLWFIIKTVRGHSALSRIGLLWMSGFLVISMLDFPKERVEHMFLFWTLMAFIQTPKLPQPMYKRTINWLGLGLSILILGYFVTRYFGEREMVKVYQHRMVQNWDQVSKHAIQAAHWKYLMDPYAIPTAWYGGIAFYQTGDFVRAHDQFSKAYEFHPFQYHVIHNLGTTFFQKGEINRAIQLYLECLQVNPYFDEAKINLAVAYARDGNYSEALEWINQLNKQTDRSQQIRQQINSLKTEGH